MAAGGAAGGGGDDLTSICDEDMIGGRRECV